MRQTDTVRHCATRESRCGRLYLTAKRSLATIPFRQVLQFVQQCQRCIAKRLSVQAAAMTAWWHDLEAGLDARREAEARRQRPTIDSPCGRTVIARGPGNARRKLLNWAGNDYFGLLRHTSVVNAAQRGARQFGAGSGSARLLVGGQQVHRRVEERFARLQGIPNALLTSSGFTAAQAMIGALLDGGRQDCLIVDRLAHACAIDGGRLAGVQLRRFKHNDVADLRRQLGGCRQGAAGTGTG